MGFATGKSCSLLHSHLHHSFLSSSSSQSVWWFAFPKNADNKRRDRTVLACMHHENSESSTRRAILLMGISVLPLLKLRARALEGELASGISEDSKMRTQEQKQRAEQTLQGDTSPNPFLFLLNGIGVFSSAVLGALYALAQKEKAATEATIESMKTKLKEKEADILSLEKNFESQLLNEKEERSRQLKKVNEEQVSLINQLKLANSTITGLGQELQKENRLAEVFKVQVDDLQTNLTKAGEDKNDLEEKLKEKVGSIEVLRERITLLSSEIKDKEDNLHNLSSALAAKELDFKKLTSNYKQTEDKLAFVNSEITKLKDELLKTEKQLELKNAGVNDLNGQVSYLLAERDDSNRKFDAIQKEYSDLKSSSDKRAASDAKILGEKEHQLHQLKEQLELALDEASKIKVLVADLTQERVDLRKLLDIELNNVKNLEQELQITQGTLEESRNEASDLGKQLQQSRNLCLELEAEISKVRGEFAEARKSLQRSLDEAKRSAEALAGELTSAKEVLKKTKEQLQIVSHELAAAVEIRDILRKELVDVYKKAKSAARDLKEEKNIVTSFNKELVSLETQILKDKEARKSLETDLEEATKSLDEMNRNALILSKDLELANSRISSLEDEKYVLYKSIAEQKQVSQGARENMEDAHNLVMRLGKERESFEKRGKKLEDELASAKGEILRLRNQINSSRALVNDQYPEKDDAEAAEGKAADSVKKTRRRRKVVPQQSKS